MRLSDFKVLTFDCYGTLIDWETGIHHALAPLLARTDRAKTRNQVLEDYARHEAAQEEKAPDMPYPQILSHVYRRMAEDWGVDVAPGEADVFGASVPDWPEFADTVEALAYLKQHYRLVILSNVDRASFRGSDARLGVAFDAVHLAQDIGSYKPSLENFEYLLRRVRADFGLGPKDILHTAQSLFHDHAPANRMGLASAWIDRRHATDGWGATMPPSVMPRYDFRFESLLAMAEAHRAEIAGDRAGCTQGSE